MMGKGDVAKENKKGCIPRGEFMFNLTGRVGSESRMEQEGRDKERLARRQICHEQCKGLSKAQEQ